MFEFKILAKSISSKARVGEFSTPHGKLITPNLAFVATEGEIKSITKEVLPTLPVNLIIVNTFHLWVKNVIQTIDDGRSKVDDEDRSSKIENNQSSILNPQDLSSTLYPLLSSFSVHDYVNFDKPIMSDSGGFQVFSMGFGKAHGVGKITNIFPQLNVGYPERAKRVEGSHYDQGNPLIINENGVEFPFNDQKLMLTPEKSIQLQQQIGADIIFAFDECTSPLNSYEYTKEAMERTHRWLKRCIKTSQINQKRSEVGKIRNQNNSDKSDISDLSDLSGIRLPISSDLSGLSERRKQALFGIIQGGHYEDLRKKSAKFVGKQDVPGFGIGGSLGRNKKDMHQVLEWVIPLLPDEKPRHLLGIGQVRDIFECVERGVDTFDCVIPTREARHQILYTKHGRVNLKKMKNVNEAIEIDCNCLACQSNVTMKQLSSLFLLKDPRAYYFSTIHNIQFFTDLMKNIREAIEIKKLSKLKEIYFKFY
ncbi:queuine tRNA-ribosyltransferase family protein [Candidatus Roizmanbacteria bacterium]|nr:queuine tRNA-ribosyltransferase family protein [Candidatus Roizmanbacteria bacterium]